MSGVRSSWEGVSHEATLRSLRIVECFEHRIEVLCEATEFVTATDLRRNRGPEGTSLPRLGMRVDNGLGLLDETFVDLVPQRISREEEERR